jgi:hypothetical protein
VQACQKGEEAGPAEKKSLRKQRFDRRLTMLHLAGDVFQNSNMRLPDHKLKEEKLGLSAGAAQAQLDDPLVCSGIEATLANRVSCIEDPCGPRQPGGFL